MKTRGIFGNELVITQTAHGTQNGKALDISSPLIAMEDVYVYDFHHIVQWHAKAGRNTEQESYFFVRMANSNDYYIVVHAYPIKLGLVKAGEEIGKKHWYWNWTTGQRADHFHICSHINGIGWVEPPCVLDRSVVKLKWAWGGDHWSTKYENYRDLSINSNIENEMVNSFLTKCKVLYDETLVRPDPNRNKTPIRKLSANTIIDVTGYAAGENVNGTNIWCYIGDGYVHKSLLTADNVKDPEVAKLKEDLVKANEQISQQNILIKELQDKNSEYAVFQSQHISRIEDLEKEVSISSDKIISLNKAIEDLQNASNEGVNKLVECEKRCEEYLKEINNSEDKTLGGIIIKFLKSLFEWIKPEKK